MQALRNFNCSPHNQCSRSVLLLHTKMVTYMSSVRMHSKCFVAVSTQQNATCMHGHHRWLIDTCTTQIFLNVTKFHCLQITMNFCTWYMYAFCCSCWTHWRIHVSKIGGSVCMESVHKRGTGACRDAKRLARNLRCNLVQSGAFWQEIDSSPVFYFCERKTLP